MRTIFFDVDTQRDLMEKSGKLYVPKAESIIPNLKSLTELARKHGIQIVSTMLRRRKDDPELKRNKGKLPDHCMDGSSGQEKIAATRQHGAAYAEQHRRYIPTQIELMRSSPEVIIEKEAISPFTSPAARGILRGVKEAYVYGMGTDAGVKEACLGLVKLKAKVNIVADAVKATHPKKEKAALAQLKRKGVRLLKTKDVLKRFA